MIDLLDGPVGDSLVVPCDLSTDAIEAAIQVIARLDRQARRHGLDASASQILRALRQDLAERQSHNLPQYLRPRYLTALDWAEREAA